MSSERPSECPNRNIAYGELICRFGVKRLIHETDMPRQTVDSMYDMTVHVA